MSIVFACPGGEPGAGTPSSPRATPREPTRIGWAVRGGAFWLLVLAGWSAATTQDDAPLTVADLDSYRTALRPFEPDAPPPVDVSFGELWERPEEFEGRRVAITGKAARRFHQPAIGEYPPLVELWLFSPTGNPTCVVYPEPEGGDPTPLGGTVRFVGWYQKRLRYRASDEDRLAPLLVGPTAPEVIRAPAQGPWRPIGPFRLVDWMVGGIVAAAVLSVIVRQMLSRPGPRLSRRQREELEGPPPRFVDGSEDSSNDGESPG
ncbi:hypothetical protein [Tautonia sociabilis]|uniref:Uncharacterized protein n=1 Tax=Tautonia sociabilis TaxID=2080755 RepID=A0A432MJV6_9BACT|nr:hypothetical protein [Tautonia sociabilis]RUL87540.1 hypothetical protein TsocGM_11940 [Tautonia sociabilis]